MSYKKILITGSTGFIGSNLVVQLSKQYELYCLYNTQQGFSNQNISYIKQDFSERIDTSKLPFDIDCIIHLAANMDKTTEKSKMFQINTMSTLDLLEYGKSIGVKKFIFVSTGGVYGYNTRSCNEESPVKPIDFYCLSKYEAELLVNHYAQFFSTIILRLFFPYGTGQIKSLLPLLTNRIKNNDPIVIYNDENPKINPIYISDIIDVINKSIWLDGQHTLNVTGDEIVSVKKLAELIGHHINSKPVFEYIYDKSVIDLIGDNTKMKKILKITPRVTLEQGVDKYLSGLK